MKTALAITDARYYGRTGTSPGPKLKLPLFSSRYNGHSRHVFKNWCHLNSCIWQNNSKLALTSIKLIVRRVLAMFDTTSLALVFL